MSLFNISQKRLRINIFKLGSAYYFKHFFDDPQIFRKLWSFYEKRYYRFRITADNINKTVEFLQMKGYEPVLIEDPRPYTIEIGRYQKYGEFLKNSIENYRMRDKIVLVVKDLSWVEQAVAMGATIKDTANDTAKDQRME